MTSTRQIDNDTASFVVELKVMTFSKKRCNLTWSYPRNAVPLRLQGHITPQEWASTCDALISFYNDKLYKDDIARTATLASLAAPKINLGLLEVRAAEIALVANAANKINHQTGWTKLIQTEQMRYAGRGVEVTLATAMKDRWLIGPKGKPVGLRFQVLAVPTQQHYQNNHTPTYAAAAHPQPTQVPASVPRTQQDSSPQYMGVGLPNNQLHVMVEKPTPKAVLGIHMGRTVKYNELVITKLPSGGLCSQIPVLTVGMKILEINGIEVNAMQPKDAAKIITNSPTTVIFLLQGGGGAPEWALPVAVAIPAESPGDIPCCNGKFPSMAIPCNRQ